MPRLKDSAVSLDATRYRPVDPTTAAASTPPPAPVLPAHLQQSPFMVSSLPPISTNVDGITRQFYGSSAPVRRISTPSNSTSTDTKAVTKVVNEVIVNNGGSGSGGGTGGQQIDWNAPSGSPAHILNQPSVSTDNQSWPWWEVRPAFNDANFLTFYFSGTAPQVTSSTGILATSATGLKIVAPPTQFGLDIEGTASPVAIYSPDASRNFKIGIANTSDPNLYSSTGVLATSATGLAIVAPPAIYGVNIQGTGTPIIAYSPDKSRNFQLGIANTTDPTLYSSTGVIATAATGLTIVAQPTHYGINIQGTGSPILAYSPDMSRSFQLGIANTTDPSLYSSTGVLSTSATGLAVVSLPANFGLTINGTASPVAIYSPDASRNFKIGMANTTDPNLYSSTGVLATAATGLKIVAPSAVYGINIQGTASPIQAYSPDASRFFQLGIANTSDPTLYSSTGMLVVNCGLTVNGVFGAQYLYASNGGVYVPSSQGSYISWNRIAGTGEMDFVCNHGGGAGGWYFFDAPASGSPVTQLFSITNSAGTPYLNSPSGLIGVSAGLVVTAAPANYGINIHGTASPIQAYSPDASRFFQLGIANTGNPTLYSSTGTIDINPGALRVMATASGLWPVAIYSVASNGYNTLWYSQDASRYLTLSIVNTGDPTLLTSTGATVLSTIAGLVRLHFAPGQAVQGSIGGSTNGAFNFSGGSYLNISTQWIPTQTSAGIMAFGGPAYNGGFSFFVNTGLTVGTVYAPTQIFSITSAGTTTVGTVTCSVIACTGNITVTGACAAGNFQVSASGGGTAGSYLQIMNNAQQGRANPWIYSSTGTVEFYPGIAVAHYGPLYTYYASALFCYSPDLGKNFQIGVPNAPNNPSLYSSTGVLNCNCAITVTSDYRIKRNIETLDGALALILKLRPVNFDYVESFASDHKRHAGFLAHELQEVLPSAVTGERDALGEDGEPVLQSAQINDLVAVLTRAVQELAGKVHAQEVANGVA